MKGSPMPPYSRVVSIACVIAACSNPTGATPSSPVVGSFVTEVNSPPRNPDLAMFDPGVVATAGSGQIEISGFIPFDLCRQTLAADLRHVGRELVITLHNLMRPDADSRICPQWIAETRYSATLTGLQVGDYRVVLIQNPARRLIGGQQVARVDTVIVGLVAVTAATVMRFESN